jgi:O-antigen ligase
VATLLLPFVVIANLANNRRTSWLILIGGFAVLFVAAWVRLPERRQLLARLAIGMAVTAALYFPLFWNSTSLLAQPARAVRSAVAPYERDLQSNQYRVYEDANLMLDIRRSAPLGLGFGVPIDYSGVPFYDLTKSNPSLRFEPHNGVLYIWLRLGSLGALVFWFVVGAGIIAACRLARSPDAQLALYGAVTLCTLIAYVVEGNYDLGLSAFRIAVFVGCILGGLEAVRPLAARM